MAVAIPTLLQPAVVNERVDRLKVVNKSLQTFWGLGKGGSAERESPMGRRGSYDVFNSTRDLIGAVAPGTPAPTGAPQPVGNVPFIIPRFHKKVPLLAEMLHNLRPIGGPVSQIDTAGQQYVADQEQILKQQVTNAREFQVAAMMRGKYYYTSADPFQGYATPSYSSSGALVTVDYQIPSGNTLKLNMLTAGDILATSWDSAATKIVSHCLAINAAFIQLTGRGLTDVHLTSIGWGHVSANTQVTTLAGSSNQFFDFINREEETQNFSAKLRAIPWLNWHINDNGLNTGTAGVFEKFIADSYASFSIAPSTIVASYWNCGEPVSEWTGQPQVVRVGEYYWVTPTADPTGYSLYSLHNGLPVLHIPAGLAYGNIVY